MVAVLFVRDDSGYKSLFRDGLDCYDKSRDAKTFKGGYPVIAHPPCRSWGVLSHMANPEPGEKELALFALEKVRENGGILEHPVGSRLFKEQSLEHDYMHGGFTIEIDQFDFGHVAHKLTKLYIFGIKKNWLPPLPPKRKEKSTRSICGNVKGTIRCTQYQREYTPELLIDWLVRVANMCDPLTRITAE